MELPELILCGVGALLVWYLFKLFSDWLVSKLVPRRGQVAALQDHFLTGLQLLQESEKIRQSLTDKTADVTPPEAATTPGLTNRRAPAGKRADVATSGGAKLGPSQRRQQVTEKLTAAVEEFDLALKADPNDASTRMIKAVALEHLGDVNGCLREISNVIDDPALRKTVGAAALSGAYFKRAGLYLYKKRKPNLAMADIEASLQLVPDDLQGICLLGQCYEAKRTYKRANLVYKKVLDMEPGYKEAEEGLERIEKLVGNGEE